MAEYVMLDINAVDLALSGAMISILWVKDYRVLVEKEIKRHLHEAKKKYDEEVGKLSDLSEEDYFAEESIPRLDYYDTLERIPLLLRGSYIVTLYSAFESAMYEIAKYVAKERNLTLSLGDLKGDLYHRIKKYFNYCLDINCAKQKDWKILTDLEKIRHIYAHKHGRLDLLDADARGEIIQSLRVNIEDNSESLIVKKEYAEEMANAVSAFIDWLIEQIKSKEPSWPKLNNIESKKSK